MSQPEIKQNRIEIGVVKKSGEYAVAALEKTDGGLRLIWDKKVCSSDMSWDEFCQEVKSFAQENGARVTLVQECSSAVYFDLEVPAVSDKQLDNIIRMQIESKLPANDDKTEFAWKKSLNDHGSCDVCVAAVKSLRVGSVATMAGCLEAERVVLDVDSFVGLAYGASAGENGQQILVRVYEDYVWIGFVENGKIISAVSLDNQLSSKANDSENILFAQDFRNVLDGFGARHKGFVGRVEIAGEDESVVSAVIGILKSRGIEAESFEVDEFVDKASVDKMSEYKDCIGGAIAAFEDCENCFDIFRNIYQSQKETQVANGSSKRMFAYGAGLAACAILFVLSFYVADKVAVVKYEKILDKDEVAKVVKIQQVRKNIANGRIEAGEILAKITENIEKGVLLSSISFGRGQRVVLSGTCGDPKKLYSFQEKLAKEKVIKDVRVQSQGLDKKKGKTKFTMSFDFKDYGKKR